MPKYTLIQNGQQVQEAISKIIALGPATRTVAGIMSAEDKAKLDSVGIHYNTTAYWNSKIGYIPAAGELIIYSDFQTAVVDGRVIEIPGIKIGSSNGYVQDLAFLGTDESGALMEHISDTAVHTNPTEKLFWCNKLNVNDAQEVVGESLVFNRN